MTTNIDGIIIVNEQELILTDIDSYFKNLAIIAEFVDGDLIAGKTFPVSGYAEYETLQALGEIFPTTHQVYKDASKVFAQRTNTGVNKSNVEKVIVVQIKATDTDFQAGLVRVGYADAYHWITTSRVADDIESASEYFLGKRKRFYAQTSDADVLTDTAGNIAETLNDGGYTQTSLFYHAIDTESLAGAVASIMCHNPVGSIKASMNKPSGITVDTITSAQETALNANNVNYYCYYKSGTGGSQMSRTGTVNGLTADGESIQKKLILDIIILNLQNAGMDALFSQIPYSDLGGGVLEEKLTAVLIQQQRNGLIAPDSNDEDGNFLLGLGLDVLTMAYTKANYPSLYASKTFKVKADITLALGAEKVEIDLGYVA